MTEIAYCTSVIALSVLGIVAIVGITIYNMEKIHLNLEGNAKLQDKTAIELKMGLSSNDRVENNQTEKN